MISTSALVVIGSGSTLPVPRRSRPVKRAPPRLDHADLDADDDGIVRKSRRK